MPIKLPSNTETNTKAKDTGLTRSEGMFGIQLGINQLSQGLGAFTTASQSHVAAINYTNQANAARRDAKNALFVGEQQANVARIAGERFIGEQRTAAAASGFAVDQGSALDLVERTRFEINEAVENIKLSTADRINNLEFQAEIADANSAFSKKVASIQAQTGLAQSAIGLAVAGYSAYNTE